MGAQDRHAPKIDDASLDSRGGYDSLDDPRTAWSIQRGNGPLVATAIHDGHDLRGEVRSGVALSEEERLREEDPLTSLVATVAPTVVRVHRSRFEVDLNRPRDKAVYCSPEEAWGLQVWSAPPSPALVQRSLEVYDAFYAAMKALFDELVAQWGRVAVFDVHSYNHRREGPGSPAAKAADNPEINLGTGTMDRERWAPVVEAFLKSMRGAHAGGKSLDVRENVKFRGGHFGQWLHHTYPTSVCVLSIELKKTFMDEWDGRADILALDRLRHTLASSVPTVMQSLDEVVAS